MTTGEWVVAIVVALGGGTGIAELVRRARGPAQRKTPTAQTPAVPTVSHADLQSLRVDFQRMVDEVRRECDSQSAELADKLVERIHQLALKVERLVAAYEERRDEDRRSRR